MNWRDSRMQRDWQPIEAAPQNVDRCLLWCADSGRNGSVVMGRILNGEPRGDGMHGDWNFTHCMPLPAPPEEQSK